MFCSFQKLPKTLRREQSNHWNWIVALQESLTLSVQASAGGIFTQTSSHQGIPWLPSFSIHLKGGVQAKTSIPTSIQESYWQQNWRLTSYNPSYPCNNLNNWAVTYTAIKFLDTVIKQQPNNSYLCQDPSETTRVFQLPSALVPWHQNILMLTKHLPCHSHCHTMTMTILSALALRPKGNI